MGGEAHPSRRALPRGAQRAPWNDPTSPGVLFGMRRKLGEALRAVERSLAVPCEVEDRILAALRARRNPGALDAARAPGSIGAMTNDEAGALIRLHHPIILQVAPRLFHDHAMAGDDAVLCIFQDGHGPGVHAGVESPEEAVATVEGMAKAVAGMPAESAHFESIAERLRTRRGFRPGWVPVVVYAGGKVSLTVLRYDALLAGRIVADA